ncbi:hypothetical protein OC846_005725 [Tilletia horrida]|uniref:SUZ domain-containing protein n=1 Tax=Tilletia horrida TaxID=155126 RepID=A0AAN6GK98_9BASI|nr:hypothetical protein OC846_005725 [Tilletia horrida]KAK0561272.1 hypothetical protein OC861_005894 [Tilletia horrida]
MTSQNRTNSYASAVARRLESASSSKPGAASSSSQSKTSSQVVADWEDDDDEADSGSSGVATASPLPAVIPATSSTRQEVDEWAIDQDDPRGPRSLLTGVLSAATMNDWTSANSSTTPRISLARRIDEPGSSSVSAGPSIASRSTATPAAGTGATASVQYAILNSNTPRILQRNPRDSNAGGASGSSTPPVATLTPEERAQALREREERYRIARERIFGSAPATPVSGDSTGGAPASQMPSSGQAG